MRILLMPLPTGRLVATVHLDLYKPASVMLKAI